MEAHYPNTVTAFLNSPDTLSLRSLETSKCSSLTSSPTASTVHSEFFEFSNNVNQSEVDWYDIRTPSFRGPDNVSNFFNDRDRFFRRNRSENRCSRSGYSVQKVNITSLTSMSTKARRRTFMLGPVKFNPEMELSAIRERHSRRTPGPMFPAFYGAETVVDDGGDGSGGEGELKPGERQLSCRAHLSNVFAKSFGCMA